MSANKINKIIDRVEGSIAELEVGIEQAKDTNSKKEQLIADLKAKLKAIITKITDWYNKKISINEDIIAENTVAIEKATNLKANIEKLFEPSDTSLIQPKEDWPRE